MKDHASRIPYHSLLITHYHSSLITDLVLRTQDLFKVCLAAFHYEAHAPQGRDVASRVAVQRDHISKESSLDLPNFFFHVQNARINRSCGTQRLNNRHAPANHGFNFSRVVTVSEDAGVAAARYRHASCEGLFENSLLTLSVRAGD